MRRTLAVLIALTLPLAVVACTSSGGDGSSAGSSGGGSAGDATAAETTSRGLTQFAEKSPAAAAIVDSSGSAGPVRSLPTKAALGPRIVQTASLRVTVRRGSFEDAVAEARTVAGGLGGYVVSSDERRDPGERLTSGALVLRVPQTGYAQAMRRLAEIGRVVGRAESGQDVSAEFVDLEARGRQFEAVETQLLKLLERAASVPAALAVQSRLDDVQLGLEEVRGRLRFLDDQTAFATITLSLRERPLAGAPAKGDDGVVDAWADGARGFAHVAGRTFVVIATIAPLLLLLGLAALLWRVLARRRLLPSLRTSERP